MLVLITIFNQEKAILLTTSGMSILVQKKLKRYKKRTSGLNLQAFWTDKEYLQRFMVVELREEFASLGDKMLGYLDKVRYHCYGANKSYYGGDIRSWQRYTHKLPLEGAIITNEDTRTVEFQLSEPLQGDTWYAVVLLHTNHSYTPYFYEDHLIPFKTKSAFAIPDDIEIPNAFLCPITQELMEDPVKLSDGHSYEKWAIAKWLTTKESSPMTGLKLDHLVYYPDQTLKSMIDQWRETFKVEAK